MDDLKCPVCGSTNLVMEKVCYITGKPKILQGEIILDNTTTYVSDDFPGSPVRITCYYCGHEKEFKQGDKINTEVYNVR